MYDDPEPTQAEHADRPLIAITMGDPNGIGPEVVLRCVTDERLRRFADFLVVGSIGALDKHAGWLGLDDIRFKAVAYDSPRHDGDGVAVLDVSPGERPKLEPGKVTETAGRLSMASVSRAVDLCLSGSVDAIVTAPISKEAIARAGSAVPGHTEFLAGRAGRKEYCMIMVTDHLRVALVTVHVAISEVPALVTAEAIRSKLRIVEESLENDFGVARPKIAVLGLNPHAGDGGILGGEENETIVPTIEQARSEGHLVFGPFAADGFFASSMYREYDAVLAMYHDQGLIPFKTLSYERGVNYTAGLPFVRTSPDHGTAFDIAGKGIAKFGSMRTAILLARDIARRRKRAGVEQTAAP